MVFFFKQKTAYEMRIIDWSSYVCSSDLTGISTTSPGGSACSTAATASSASGVRHDGAARHHPSRRLGHAAVSDHPGDQQAAAAGLRQADDLLPAQERKSVV